jgi:putative ABC transport system ATP-binding protein
LSALYKLHGIEKTYQSGSVPFHALRGIDLEIASGEVVALCGPSGSGKSTLLNVLGLIEKPTAGRIHFSGHDIEKTPESTLTKVRRESVGFIFQNFNLIPVLSALENVEYALFLEGMDQRSAIREQAKEVLSSLGLAQYLGHRPAQLSGGQRQRVAIARAIVKQPNVVVADEPTANLDSKTANQIMDLVMRLNQTWGTTVVLATHDESVAKQASKVVHIHDGVVDRIH